MIMAISFHIVARTGHWLGGQGGIDSGIDFSFTRCHVCGVVARFALFFSSFLIFILISLIIKPSLMSGRDLSLPSLHLHGTLVSLPPYSNRLVGQMTYMAWAQVLYVFSLLCLLSSRLCEFVSLEGWPLSTENLSLSCETSF